MAFTIWKVVLESRPVLISSLHTHTAMSLLSSLCCSVTWAHGLTAVQIGQ